MKVSVLAMTAALLFGTGAAYAVDPQATIADLDARLAKIGAPRIEGTEKIGDKTVPAMYFGNRKINGNYDVVDAVRKAHGATATVFVKDGEEFVRVSTNVLTPEGKRGVLREYTAWAVALGSFGVKLRNIGPNYGEVR